MGTITLDGIDFPVRDASFAGGSSGLELEVNGGHADVPEAHEWWILEPRLCLSAPPIDPAQAENLIAIPAGAECQCCLVAHEPESVTRAEIRLIRTRGGHHLSASGETTIMGSPVRFQVETDVELRW